MICQRSCRLLPKIFTCLYLINKHSEHHLMHFFFAVWRSQCKSSSWTVQIHTDKSSIPTTQQTASQRYESTISIQNINDHMKQISHYYWHVVFNLLNHSFGALACIIVPNHTKTRSVANIKPKAMTTSACSKTLFFPLTKGRPRYRIKHKDGGKDWPNGTRLQSTKIINFYSLQKIIHNNKTRITRI